MASVSIKTVRTKMASLRKKQRLSLLLKLYQVTNQKSRAWQRRQEPQLDNPRPRKARLPLLERVSNGST